MGHGAGRSQELVVVRTDAGPQDPGWPLRAPQPAAYLHACFTEHAVPAQLLQVLQGRQQLLLQLSCLRACQARLLAGHGIAGCHVRCYAAPIACWGVSRGVVEGLAGRSAAASGRLAGSMGGQRVQENAALHNQQIAACARREAGAAQLPRGGGRPLSEARADATGRLVLSLNVCDSRVCVKYRARRSGDHARQASPSRGLSAR